MADLPTLHGIAIIAANRATGRQSVENSSVVWPLPDNNRLRLLSHDMGRFSSCMLQNILNIHRPSTFMNQNKMLLKLVGPTPVLRNHRLRFPVLQRCMLSS